MSELPTSAIWPSPAASSTGRRPLRLAVVAFWLVVVAGAALTAAALPTAIAFSTSAPPEFWVLAALALVADLTPFRLPPPARRSTIFLVSVCFCFAIALLYGAPPAMIVQVLAVGAAVPRLHLRWPSSAFLTAGLICSLAAAGWVASLMPVYAAGMPRPYVKAVLVAAMVMLTFLVVTLAISVIGALISGATRGEVVGQLRIEVLARSSVLVVGLAIVAVPSQWSIALLVVPLIGWYELARRLEDQERRLEHDPVSGLLSRRGLSAAMSAVPREHSRETEYVALIVVQLRGMAYVSRTFGPIATEQLVVAAADLLRAGARADDVIGQLSESQFAVLRPAPVNGDSIRDARRVAAVLSEPVESNGVPFRLHPVAGVAVAPQHGDGLDSLMAYAEAALVDAGMHYDVARAYSPKSTADVEERLGLLREFNAAVQDPGRSAEIIVLYQPQVSLTTGQTNSVEALLRWTHPDRGPIPTDTLIQIVEPTAVMQILTRHMVDRVVSQLAEWNRAGYELRAAVNVSVIDVCTERFEVHLADTLRRYGVSPNQLDIEITERALGETSPILDEATRRISETGVGVSLDDFGTGFASLHRLRQMHLAEVKIDRSLVSRVADSQPDRAIVTTIHHTANALGLRVVAEGIEDERTERILASLGAIHGQGWLYARPMTAQQLLDWLHARGRMRRGVSRDDSWTTGGSGRPTD
jgi:diguanylate cyclase